MKAVLLFIAFALCSSAGLAGAGSWLSPGFFPQAQAQKGRGGPGGGFERGREMRQERREERREERQERRERLTDDERRSLHRDLDKANREIYGRPQR